MKHNIFFVLLVFLLASCSKSNLEESQRADVPIFDKNSPAGLFHARASAGPVDKSECTRVGGEVLAPIEYEDPVSIAQGVAIYKHKKDGMSRVGVSFVTSSSALIVLHTCGWGLVP